MDEKKNSDMTNVHKNR